MTISPLRTLRFALLSVLLITLGRSAQAQVASLRSQGPGTVSGAISTSEIELMETQLMGGTRGSRPDLNDNTAMVRVAGGRKLCTHVVWLRK